MNFREKYGPWAVVAGASHGMGAEFAAQLAARGIHLILIARREEQLISLSEQLMADYGIQARCLTADLAEEEAVPAILDFTKGIQVGLLIYNAAYSAIGPFWKVPAEDHYIELQVNCYTPLALVHAFGQKWIERGRGGLILLSSLSSAQGSAYISNYAATKAYNQVLAEGLWEEMRGTGVDILACCPGATRTPNFLRSLERYPAQDSAPSMEPSAVVTETLAALGKQPSIIPGRSNRFAALMMRHLMPRWLAVRVMGRVLRKMYQVS